MKSPGLCGLIQLLLQGMETARVWGRAQQELARSLRHAGVSELQEGAEPRQHLHLLVIKAESELYEVVFFPAEGKLLSCIHLHLSACQLLPQTFESPHMVFSPAEQNSSLSG